MTTEPIKSKVIIIKAGDSVLVYNDGKVVSNRDFKSHSAIFTKHDSFIGTKAEVEAKIIELGLTETL
jgi:tartrate dehydratase beta subunit/fumarate hydratase class I family protein